MGMCELCENVDLPMGIQEEAWFAGSEGTVIAP